MKENDLYDMIGNTDDSIVKEAQKKPVVTGWTKWVSIVAFLCMVIIGGVLFFTQIGKKSAPGSVAGGHDDGSEFMSYAGPVFPLTLREDNSAISANRNITLDFAPWLPVWISNEEEASSRSDLTEEERQDVLNTYNEWYPEGGRHQSSGNILVTDSYTIANEDVKEQSVIVLYPFVSSIGDLTKKRPTLTLNGDLLDTALHSGSYAGGFQGAWENWSETHNNPGSLNLAHLESWEGYRNLLADGTYLQRALSDYVDFSDIPVTVYEITDAWGQARNEEADIPNPTIRVMFDLDYAQTRILSYGFNQTLNDEEQGIMGRGFNIPESGRPGYGVPEYIIVIGEDIGNIYYQGYATGGWDTEKTIEAGVMITRKESNLEEALRTAAAYQYQELVDAGNCFEADPEYGFELYFGLMKEHLAAYGILAENGAERYADGMIENLDVHAVDRVFWLEAKITIPAGTSVKLDAAFEKNPSFDFDCVTGNKGIRGYDFVTRLGSNLTFTGQITKLEAHDQLEIVRQNFGFDLANDITEVELDLNEPHYFLEVRTPEER